MKKNVTLKAAAAFIAAVFALTACATATTTTAPAAAPEEAPAAVTEEAPAAAEEAAEAPAESAEWEGDIDEIEVVLFDIGNGNEGTQPIVDAANAITEKTIGVRAKINYLPVGDFITQVNLMLSSSEPIDIVNFSALPGTDFTTLMANGQLMDITDYMEEDGKDIIDMMGDYLGATSMNGRIYGVSTYRSYGSGNYIIMRQDMLEDAGMVEKARNASTWTDIDEIFAAVAESNPNISATIGGTGMASGSIYAAENFADAIMFDPLGDANYLIYNDNGNLSLLPEEATFRAQQERIRGWYEDGYVYKDSILDSTDAVALISDAQIMSMAILGEIGAEETWSDRIGAPVVAVELNKNVLRSSTICNFGLAVPVTADEPEAAVRWMNELYTNPELENLLCWGIEGEDYIVKDGVGYFPEGVDAINARYHKTEFAYGNYFNLLPWDGNTADFREVAMDFLNGFEVSPYLSFNVDLSEDANTVAAISTVLSKYKLNIYAGVFDDEYYDEYVSSLKAAGVEDLIATYQEQLNAYLGQ